jgi:hypothetical protein
MIKLGKHQFVTASEFKGSVFLICKRKIISGIAS